MQTIPRPAYEGTVVFEYQFDISHSPVRQPMLHLENAMAVAEEEWHDIIRKHREKSVILFRVIQWHNGKRQLIKDFLDKHCSVTK